jgi:type I restriction enzyme, S subunit
MSIKTGEVQNLINGIGFGSSEYIVFRPNKELSNEFLYYFLSRKRFIEEGAVRMSGAVGHKRVSKEFIEGYKIAFPLLDMQKGIVKKIDDLSQETQRLEALYQRKIDLLDELKKSLLQQAFAGEL